ncbi:sulfatase-like hydrolase/transferase [Vallitaleaceae bacterium 9-2]
MKKKPNILFIMTDEQKFDAIGYRNPEVITPHLDALAKQSINFSNAYTTNPSCIPARAAIFTGRYPSQNGASGYMTPLNENETTFMKLLQDGGYHTAVVGKQHFWKSAVDRGYDYEDIVDEHEPPEVIFDQITDDYFGLPAHRTTADRVSSYVQFLYDSGFTRGEQLYREVNAKGIYEFFGDEKYYVDSYVGDRGLEWIEEKRPTDQPWFMTLSFPGPHMPFDGLGLPDDALYEDMDMSLPTTSVQDLFTKPPHFLDIVKKYGKVDLENQTSPDGFTDEELRLLKRAYYANMTLIDRKIGAVIEKLKALDLYDDTLILFTSDHGDFLGDFGVASKAQYCSEALLRIPFLMKPPIKDFAGYEEKSFISSVEIAATCLKAAEIPIPKNISTRSLTSFYTEPQTVKRWSRIYLEARDIRSIRDERFKFVYYMNRSYGELYDLAIDPEEKYNLWDNGRYSKVKKEMRLKLMDKLIELGENSHIPWHVEAPSI